MIVWKNTERVLEGIEDNDVVIATVIKTMYGDEVVVSKIEKKEGQKFGYYELGKENKKGFVIGLKKDIKELVNKYLEER